MIRNCNCNVTKNKQNSCKWNDYQHELSQIMFACRQLQVFGRFRCFGLSCEIEIDLQENLDHKHQERNQEAKDQPDVDELQVGGRR